ncbi:MAG: hypothetical protein QW292_09130 [Candidatus Parvarchaeota archaeon]
MIRVAISLLLHPVPHTLASDEEIMFLSPYCKIASSSLRTEKNLLGIFAADFEGLSGGY